MTDLPSRYAREVDWCEKNLQSMATSPATMTPQTMLDLASRITHIMRIMEHEIAQRDEWDRRRLAQIEEARWQQKSLRYGDD